jgi:hypothetical protein
MAIVVASMVVIVLAGVAVLGFAFSLHLTRRSPRFRARARRMVISAAARFYAIRRATRRRLEPVLARLESRVRTRETAEPELERVPAQSGQQ